MPSVVVEMKSQIPSEVRGEESQITKTTAKRHLESQSLLHLIWDLATFLEVDEVKNKFGFEKF